MHIYKDRINKLLERVRKLKDDGLVVLFSGFEQDRIEFVQDSTFYYFTGINEPGVVLLVDILTSKTTLLVPKFSTNRADWVIQEDFKIGMDSVSFLGEDLPGYSVKPFFTEHSYKYLIEILSKSKNVFSTCPSNISFYGEQMLILAHLNKFVPDLNGKLFDISLEIAQLRQIKSKEEIELIYKAIDITSVAYEAAFNAIKDGATELEVKAAIEYVFTASNAKNAFPSIIASGKNSTILHYTGGDKALKNGELVVVDIGAMYRHYCADLTRTFAVSGEYTYRQKEILDIVLEVQEYIVSIARPGLWLSNADHKEKSLHHLAKEFLKEKGYADYFIHGIGHYLGLDVHDVGDYSQPLQKGQVFTIEPGIYLPQEEIGIRIEDNYWVVEDGVVCLSENLPKVIE
jgi:Xaa-Pro aminopeptidase